MEENRRFSWSDLFIKIILVVIFVLFTVWLLSLSTKDLSNSLDVLTDNIFSENLEKMKNVGKDYFTIERLPSKVGEVETLTLEEMYKKNLILEIKDKDGNACSSQNSYVSIEKFDNEYQMKIYLECGEESNHIIVIMGCNDLCDSDSCTIKEDKEEVKKIEYQYVKTTDGKWTDYGKWGEWSKVEVTNTDYRQVETKVEKEEYSYDKTVTKTIYASLEVSCPVGYKMTADKKECYKEVTDTLYTDPVCSNKSATRNGFTCTSSKIVTKTADFICLAKSGWTYTGMTGLTCNYKRNVQSSDYTLKYVETKTGSTVPADTSTYDYVKIDSDYIRVCNDKCAFEWVYTYEVYKKVYGTTPEKTTASAVCPSGYKNISGVCKKDVTEPVTETAVCPSGYTKSGNTCSKSIVKKVYEKIKTTCPSGYKLTSDKKQCYKEVQVTEKVTSTRDVTYYRYRVREYIGGTTDYKWSTSKNDKKLLDAGYKLTGRTR